jgi:wyosine [tRNA(Phe)-imidazoG37] synthetase (radical SAM superfamily)
MAILLVRRLHETKESLQAVAQFIVTLQPIVVYVSVPTHSPMESWVPTKVQFYEKLFILKKGGDRYEVQRYIFT